MIRIDSNAKLATLCSAFFLVGVVFGAIVWR